MAAATAAVTTNRTDADHQRLVEVIREALAEAGSRPSLVPATDIDRWADQLAAAAGDDTELRLAIERLRDTGRALVDDLGPSDRCGSVSRVTDALLDLHQMVA